MCLWRTAPSLYLPFLSSLWRLQKCAMELTRVTQVIILLMLYCWCKYICALQKLSDRKSPPQLLTSETREALDAALSFGYGLIQVAISIVPAGLLKVCELLGFTADRDIGLDALEVCSRSDDMKAPIAR